jgi:hypothetical protein
LTKQLTFQSPKLVDIFKNLARTSHKTQHLFITKLN